MEGQLCNAQSLIHKLLKHIDSHPNAPVMPKPLDSVLRERAKAHIDMLLAHKKKEHAEDVAAAQSKAMRLEATLDQQRRQEIGHRNAASLTSDELAKAEAALARLTDITDEEILG